MRLSIVAQPLSLQIKRGCTLYDVSQKKHLLHKTGEGT